MKKLLFNLLLISSVQFSFAQVNLSTSLTACYTLNGNANDPISNLTGTLNNVTSTSDRFNNPSSAYNFGGLTPSFIELPNSPLLKPNAISVSFWTKLNSLNATMSMVFAKNMYLSYNTSYNCAVVKSFSVYKFTLFRQDGSNSDYVNSTTTIVPNTWYHVAFSINNTDMKLYVNGILEGSLPCTITAFNYDPAGSVILGGAVEVNQPLEGVLDNVKFYNRILAVAEINTLYSSDSNCSLTTGINNESDIKKISVYPNPTSGKITLDVFDPTVREYEVFNLLGTRILNGKINDLTKGEIDLSNFPNGIYFLKFSQQDASKTIKIVKE